MGVSRGTRAETEGCKRTICKVGNRSAGLGPSGLVRVWVVGVKSRKGIEGGDATHLRSPGKQELNAKQKNGGTGICERCREGEGLLLAA